jgi:hypothetical protein
MGGTRTDEIFRKGIAGSTVKSDAGGKGCGGMSLHHELLSLVFLFYGLVRRQKLLIKNWRTM